MVYMMLSFWSSVALTVKIVVPAAVPCVLVKVTDAAK